MPFAEALPVLDDLVTRVLGGVHMYTPPADLIDAAAHGRLIDLRPLPNEHRVALLVTALRPILHAQFQRALEEYYATISPGLPAAARVARLREIDAELGQLERLEEDLIAELSAAGVSIDRRPDSDPAILLGLGVTNHAATQPIPIPSLVPFFYCCLGQSAGAGLRCVARRTSPRLGKGAGAPVSAANLHLQQVRRGKPPAGPAPGTIPRSPPRRPLSRGSLMAQANVIVRLNLKDAEVVKRGLEQTGVAGEKARGAHQV